ncbi:MAG: MIP/aquaporin family protein [Pseudomonadota bacterium]
MSQTNRSARPLAAEAIGTFFLLATVVGSGIMAERLAGGNVAIALLGNTIPTGAILVVMITMLGPVSGAHFNPAVTLTFALRKEIKVPLAVAYVIVQVIAGIAGVWAAHLMFGETLLQFSLKVRSGGSQWFAEFVATFGLVLVILATIKARESAVAMAAGLYITAAYWFTASTSFANPAVTVARGFSDTFAGIRPEDVAPFILAQLAGSVAAWALCRWFLEHPSPLTEETEV